MTSRREVMTLRFLLVLGALVLLMCQVFVLPWMAADFALDEPRVAYLRWPVLALSILVLACVQWATFAVWRLLDRVGAGCIFDLSSLRWVDQIIRTLYLGGLLALVILALVLAAPAGSPPVVLLVVAGALLATYGASLLMRVMRGLLLQAAEFKTEIDGTI